MKYSAVQCSAVQYNAVQCSTVQCNAMQFSTVQCCAVQYSVVQCSAPVHHIEGLQIEDDHGQDAEVVLAVLLGSGGFSRGAVRKHLRGEFSQGGAESREQ